jgi:hypothetical protein
VVLYAQDEGQDPVVRSPVAMAAQTNFVTSKLLALVRLGDADVRI